MKVLQINSYFAGSTFYVDLFAALERLGVQEDIYVFTHTGNELKQAYPSNVRLRRPYIYADRFLFPLKHKKVYRDLTRLLPIRDYEVAHAHSLFSNGYIALQLKKEFGLPYIATIRSSDINTFFRYALHLHPIGKEILREASGLVFVSRPHRDEVLKKYVSRSEGEALLKKSEFIPNGVNVYWREHMAEPRTKTHDPLRLLFVGDINRNKNVLATVKACELLRQQGRDVIYTVIGNVKDARIESALREKSYVTLNPFTESRDVLRQAYRTHDIYIMPSKTETFGISYVEAMSQGLPIIYSSGQGFDGQFQNGEVGFAVRHNNPSQIAANVLRIEADYAAFSARAIQGVQEFYWENIAGSLLKLYQRAAEEIPFRKRSQKK